MEYKSPSLGLQLTEAMSDENLADVTVGRDWKHRNPHNMPRQSNTEIAQALALSMHCH